MTWKEKILSLGVDGWQLYDNNESARAAKDMSERLVILLSVALHAIAEGEDKVELATDVRESFLEVQLRYGSVGADDTEPDWVVVDMINNALGTEISRW